MYGRRADCTRLELTTVNRFQSLLLLLHVSICYVWPCSTHIFFQRSCRSILDSPFVVCSIASGNFIRSSFIFDVVSTFCTIILSTVVGASMLRNFSLCSASSLLISWNVSSVFVLLYQMYSVGCDERAKSESGARGRRKTNSHTHILFIYICALCSARIMCIRSKSKEETTERKKRRTVLLYA